MHRTPAVIISYVNMGNIFPVTEDRRGPHSLLGSALKSGYNSHFVLTNVCGSIYHEEKDDIVCNEIVVGQESQILPAFIITLDIDSCRAEFIKWVRVIPQPMNDAALKEHGAQKNSSLQEEVQLESSCNSLIDLEDGSEHYFLLT